MAFLNDLFGKKEEMPPQQGAPQGTPVDEVLRLRSQRLSNNQIIQVLQQEGYNLTQINNALAQAQIKGIVEPIKMEGMNMPENPMQMQPPPMQQGMQPGMQQFAGAPMQSSAGMSSLDPREEVRRVEEIAEAIIDEKWDDLIKSIEKVIEWKDKVEIRIVAIEEQMKSLRNDFDKLHTSILDKVSDYDQSITTVGTNIKALEQVFKKVLPGFVENVNELGRIADTMKKSAKK